MSSYLAPTGAVTFVAGTIFRPDAVEAVADAGITPSFAVLRREPQNPHDPNAIAVDIWGHHVGYLPADEAVDYAPLMDAHLQGMEVLATIREFTADDEIALDLAKPKHFLTGSTTGAETAPSRPSAGPARNSKGQFVKAEPAPGRPKKARSYAGAIKVYRVCAYVLLALGLVGSVLNGSILFFGLAALFWWLQKRMPATTPKGDPGAA
ncbi:HIRAN domain-containing protein [Kocuria sp.]|uniref:HIRAN domain-containing protein n=1 Tax=Kocuria sp. TaxID=1871328 RepID=UPI0026DCFC70|nr:HIRAN domain-containing protein [Kocuria sp.]MDO4919895.1 HIRAN domain-containing protein [Kocuria sp.]